MQSQMSYNVNAFWSIWTASLKAVTLRQFKSLEGFEWRISYPSGRYEGLLQKLNLMSDAALDESKLKWTISALQRHRLRPELTLVRFREYRTWEEEGHTESESVASSASFC